MYPKSQSKLSKSAHTTVVTSWNHSPTPSFTTDDLLIAKYTRWSLLLEWSRIVLAGLSFAISITITACAGVALHTYNDTHTPQLWLLPIWPANVDLRPTKASVAIGALVAVMSLAYLVLAFAPLRSKARLAPIISVILSILSCFLILVSTIFSAVLSNAYATSHSKGTLNSWTCKWRDGAFEDRAGDAVSPPGFERICNHSSASYDLVILMVVMTVAWLGLSVAGFVVGKKLEGVHRGAGGGKVEMV